MASFVKKPGITVAGVLLGLLLVSGIGNTAETRKKVRLAYAEWGVGSAIAYVGIDGGIFKKFNIEVEEIFIKDAFSGGIQTLIGADILLGFGNPLGRRPANPYRGRSCFVGIACEQRKIRHVCSARDHERQGS